MRFSADLVNQVGKGLSWGLPLFSLFFEFLVVTSAGASETYYEGKEAETIIKFGDLQEKIKEEDHFHLVLEYEGHVFWCTIENSGEKICSEY